MLNRTAQKQRKSMESNKNEGMMKGAVEIDSGDERKSCQCDFQINYVLGKQLLVMRANVLSLLNGI